MYELPQSHCGNNREDTLFSWLDICITPILLLRDFSTSCVMDHLWPLIYKYMHFTTTLTLKTKASHCSKCENRKSLVLPQKNMKDYLLQVTLTFCTNLALKFHLNANLSISFFANLFRITEITWSTLPTLIFKDN